MAQEFTMEAVNKIIKASEGLMETASQLKRAVEENAELLKGEDIAVVNKDQEELVANAEDMAKTINEGADACLKAAEGIKRTLEATGNL